MKLRLFLAIALLMGTSCTPLLGPGRRDSTAQAAPRFAENAHYLPCEVSTLKGLSFLNEPESGNRSIHPYGLDVDDQGVLYVADSIAGLYMGHIPDLPHCRILKITRDGAITILAGGDKVGYADGRGGEARFNLPTSVALAPDGSLYVSDTWNHSIRKVASDGTVTTLAGNRQEGFSDGKGSEAMLNGPQGLAVDPQGILYVADTVNNRIRKITPDGTVATLAGGSESGFVDGPGTSARFNSPEDIAIDRQGNLYVVDSLNHSVRKVTPEGMVTTVAGNGKEGHVDAQGKAAQFFGLSGIAIDGEGNLVVTQSPSVRLIRPDGTVWTLAGRGLQQDYADGPGDLARFWSLQSIAIDHEGTIIVGDYEGPPIRVIRRSAP